MYIDAATGAPLSGGSPDPRAGLYIRDRKGALHHAAFAPDELAFQIGAYPSQHPRAVYYSEPAAASPARRPRSKATTAPHVIRRGLVSS
jgi:hypothetical protein